MRKLYHSVPDKFDGDTLYPLNKLKEKYPKRYKEQLAKYQGRKQVMRHKIEYLDCLRNDVVFLSPVHPDKIKKALQEFNKNWKVPSEYREIPSDRLDRKKMCIYKHTERPRGILPDKSDFIPYNEDYLVEHDNISQASLNYYNMCNTTGKRPLLYVYLPHVMYKGPIPIKNLQRIPV